MNTQKAVLRILLQKPIVEWPRALQASKASYPDIESELSALIQRATLMHGYIGHRFNTGCGEHRHDDSAKAARKQLVKVRKALGFSYPESTPLGGIL